MNDDEEQAPCPLCGGPGRTLGPLGKREWYRCQNCGWTFAVEPDDTINGEGIV